MRLVLKLRRMLPGALNPDLSMRCVPQLEVIAMLGQLMGRTLVLPDHTSTFFVNMEGNVSLNDFYDIARLAAWVPVISMQEYMDVRWAPNVTDCI